MSIPFAKVSFLKLYASHYFTSMRGVGGLVLLMCRVRCGSGGDTVGGLNNWEQEGGRGGIQQKGHTQLYTFSQL